jgi:hypothetical protein
MIILAISDTHIGSAVGLWKPGYPIQENLVPQLNQFQLWLWECWETMLAEVRARVAAAHARGEKVVCVHLGDGIQGGHEKDGQLVTNRTDIQAKCLYYTLLPLRQMVDRMYVMHGTAWHGGKVSSHLSTVLEFMDLQRSPETGEPMWWDLNLDVDGYRINFSHHVGANMVPMYEATAPLRDAYILGMEAITAWGPGADWVDLTVVGHRHRCIFVWKPPRIRALVCPGWQLKNEFVWKVSSKTLPQIGFCWIETVELLGLPGKRLMITPRLFELPKPHIECLEALETSNGPQELPEGLFDEEMAA